MSEPVGGSIKIYTLFEKDNCVTCSAEVALVGNLTKFSLAFIVHIQLAAFEKRVC